MRPRFSLTILLCLLSLPATWMLSPNSSAQETLQRIPWTTSKVIGSPDPPKPYQVARVFPEIQFTNPVEVLPLADTGKMIALEVSGKLKTFDDVPDASETQTVLDLSERTENFRRAFGLGVHPDFKNNRQIFLVYALNPVANPVGSRLSRFVMRDQNGLLVVDPDSEEILLTWASGGHNGSAIRFDPDGLLYFSTGDGARPFPPDEYDVSQDLSDLRSTVCRIDVDRRDGDKGYAIPKDNPFINTPDARGEIWAYGFRNPWRFDLVPGTNRILLGDVGWERWELVFDVRRGGNYGWSIFEGPQPIRSDIERGPTEISKPLVSYPHSVGQSITGGVVYTGKQHGELDGVYLYGDYVSGLLWGLRYDKNDVTENPVLSETGLRIITIGRFRDGEPMIVDYGGGIYKLTKTDTQRATDPFPRKLSDTGLFAETKTLDPNPGVYRYNLAAQAWQDGDVADFVIGIPDAQTIRIARQQRGWKYPAGTVFAKTISRPASTSRPAHRIETQLLHFDGINWQPYSYLWNQQQDDAELVDAGGADLQVSAIDADGMAAEKTYRVSNRAECRSCHTPQTGGAVGFTLENLGQKQVERFKKLKILNQVPPQGWKIRHMVDPLDESLSIQDRARSYLMANCAHCHRRGGGGTVALDLVYSNTNNAVNAIDYAPTQGSFGIDNAKVIVPGHPERSVLYYRMATSGAGHMPKLWTRMNDMHGLDLVRDWIKSLTPDVQRNQTAATDQTFASTEQSLLLFSQISGQSVEEKRSVARKAAANDNVVTSGLFQRFLPESERRKVLGKQVNADSILALKGSVGRGRAAFFDGNALQCITCHRVQGTGKSVGPDLDNIKTKRTKDHLLQSILNPSKDVDQQYVVTVVVTADGEVHQGLKIAENSKATTLRVSSGKDVTIDADEIEQTKTLSRSLMPDGLEEQMTAQELADLIAFLDSLQGEPSIEKTGR